MQCGKTFLYLKKKVGSSFFFAFVPARCKSWSCPKCRLIKSRIVENYVREHFAGDELYMLTLTYFHSGTVEDAWLRVGPSWNRLRSYVNSLGRSISYMRIVEPHRTGGWPHMHVLIRGCVIDSKVLSHVTDWGFGWNCQVQKISSLSASSYVSKYLSKPWPDALSNVLREKTKTRIVCVSQDMPAVFSAKSEWECVQWDMPDTETLSMFNSICRALKNNGASVILSHGWSDGFIIQSDIDISLSDIINLGPYVWIVVQDSYDFEYLKYGFQTFLDL